MILNSAMWNWTSPIWFVAMGLLIACFSTMRAKGTRRTWPLALAAALLILAYVSPIGVLADGYLFSAHMVQHLLLLLVIPLCLLVSFGRPTGSQAVVSSSPDSTTSTHTTRLQVVCWLCGVGAMWFWHVPALCSASAQSHVLGTVRDVSFVAAGLAFWWPLFGATKRYRLQPLHGIAYLFSACSGCTLLGIYITFTTISVCPAFANPVDRIGILNMLYDAGLTPGVDQHLGGLLMWVPPCTLYVSASVCLLCRWYSELDHDPAGVPGTTTIAKARP